MFSPVNILLFFSFLLSLSALYLIFQIYRESQLAHRTLRSFDEFRAQFNEQALGLRKQIDLLEARQEQQSNRIDHLERQLAEREDRLLALLKYPVSESNEFIDHLDFIQPTETDGKIKKLSKEAAQTVIRNPLLTASILKTAWRLFHKRK